MKIKHYLTIIFWDLFKPYKFKCFLYFINVGLHEKEAFDKVKDLNKNQIELLLK